MALPGEVSRFGAIAKTGARWLIILGAGVAGWTTDDSFIRLNNIIAALMGKVGINFMQFGVDVARLVAGSIYIGAGTAIYYGSLGDGKGEAGAILRKWVLPPAGAFLMGTGARHIVVGLQIPTPRIPGQ